MVGYLPDYRLEAWSKNAGPLTDLVYFGMSAPANGQFAGNAIPKKHLKTLQAFKTRFGCRILFTVGGWNKSQGFAALAAKPETRAQFIQDARDFCIRNQLDGIDFDWEHPRGAQQLNDFAHLLKETHSVFSREQLWVTIAQASWQTFDPKVYQTVDRVHLMAYDHEFPQATIEKSTADVKRLIKAGCPRKKIILGLPFYGRNKSRVAKTYSELLQASPSKANSSLIDGFAFNGPSVITRKVRDAKKGKLGGVMIWELGQDVTGPNSLLKAVEMSVRKP